MPMGQWQWDLVCVCQVHVPDQEAGSDSEIPMGWDHCMFVCQVCEHDQEADDENEMASGSL